MYQGTRTFITGAPAPPLFLSSFEKHFFVSSTVPKWAKSNVVCRQGDSYATQTLFNP